MQSGLSPQAPTPGLSGRAFLRSGPKSSKSFGGRSEDEPHADHDILELLIERFHKDTLNTLRQRA